VNNVNNYGSWTLVVQLQHGMHLGAFLFPIVSFLTSLFKA
jgi:hypothetical protein